MSDFLPLEKEVLAKLLAGSHPILESLRNQLEKAVIAGREFTGVGFFTDLIIDEVFALPGKPKFTIGDVDAIIPGIKHGAGFVLFIEQGLLKMLEGYTYDDPWPEEITNFSVQYSKNGKSNIERDFEKLEEELSLL